MKSTSVSTKKAHHIFAEVRYEKILSRGCSYKQGNRDEPDCIIAKI